MMMWMISSGRMEMVLLDATMTRWQEIEAAFEAQLKMVSRILKMLEMGDASLDNWEELHQSMYLCYYYYDDDDNVMFL